MFSAAGFLKTTGPRDIEASPEGSRRFAYSERPARCGGPDVEEFDIFAAWSAYCNGICEV